MTEHNNQDLLNSYDLQNYRFITFNTNQFILVPISWVQYSQQFQSSNEILRNVPYNVQTIDKINIDVQVNFEYSHKLFDFERNIPIEKIIVDSTKFIVLRSNKIELVDMPNQDSNILLKIFKQNSTFWIEKFKKDIWIIASNINKYKLSELDIVRIGTTKLRFRFITTNFDCNILPIISKYVCNQDDSDDNICRICQDGPDGIDNPLIIPCNCNGSIKYVHKKCLNKWIKINSKSSNSSNSSNQYYYWQERNCEICKHKYPFYIKNGGDIIPLVDIPYIEPPYIILEEISKKNLGIHLISLSTNKEFTIGRSSSANLQLLNESISKIHATISFEDDNFYLNDNNSLFGTLILLKQPIKDISNLHKIQVGSTVLTFNK
jgi:hypothetical protein